MHAWPITTNTPRCWQELTSHRHSEHHTAQSQHIFSCSFQQSGSLGLIKLIQHRKMLLWTHKQEQNGFDCQTKEIQVSRKYPPSQKKTIYIQTTAYKPAVRSAVCHIYSNLAMNSCHSHRTHSQIPDSETQPFTIMPPGSRLLPISASIDNDTF